MEDGASVARLEQRQHEEIAKQLWEVACSDIPMFDPSDPSQIAAHFRWTDERNAKVDALIKNTLTHKSLQLFMMMTIQNATGERQRTNTRTGRHKEDIADKSHIFNWLNANPDYKSAPEAAEAMLGQVSQSNRTLQNWFREWKKNRGNSAAVACALPVGGMVKV